MIFQIHRVIALLSYICLSLAVTNSQVNADAVDEARELSVILKNIHAVHLARF